MLSKLRDDPHEDELLRMAEEDVLKGRLSGPYSIQELDLERVAIASRFSIEQGTHPWHMSAMSCARWRRSA